MKRIIPSILALVFTISLSSIALAYDKGDRVLGLWEDAYWYPATVTAVKDNILTLTFDDGDVATFDPERVSPLNWDAGDKVECRWPQDNKNYPGVLLKRDKDKVRILYDDGDKADLSIAKCRQSRLSRLNGR